ncbi:MAG: hypothetical protein NT154_20910 [Verrucomicrobia bacterium]|nr:hypothetical protein [Verrucomicrobiota bacterium]
MSRHTSHNLLFRLEAACNAIPAWTDLQYQAVEAWVTNAADWAVLKWTANVAAPVGHKVDLVWALNAAQSRRSLRRSTSTATGLLTPEKSPWLPSL